MDRYVAIHAKPNGPGDARTTAEQVLADEELAGKWQDRTVLITGATSGLGMEIARVLHKTGAKIFITSRQQAKGDEVAQAISSENPAFHPVEAIEMPMDSFESVRKVAAVFPSKGSKLDVLLLNAGVMAAPEGRTKDGSEIHFGTNYLAHFLLFQLPKPSLLQASKSGLHSRVVILSSGAHKSNGVHPDNYNLEGDYNPYMAYAQSKTANIYMANESNRRFSKMGSMHCPSTQALSLILRLLVTKVVVILCVTTWPRRETTSVHGPSRFRKAPPHQFLLLRRGPWKVKEGCIWKTARCQSRRLRVALLIIKVMLLTHMMRVWRQSFGKIACVWSGS
ncbi:hypothetical protein AUEXF2481DRAFT_44488 [Aureobasidium subglaciale EXF-2481]|uniref:NAD(P)-binding protein n=1 Tax=Aureobasidium subglaciale (strain EXF-2481) TaxID=1043005 RepID=A0A074YA90_AURSE|nr:uncharacterized protein AUEXF2481DRAFT_44488 [Aureobasidium subglaciale EXF-2481]KEQ91092.1 hypothetical protein AUEXF2481DRAFT_44488 [Aureobasidium subglaciale EXF-2481]